MPVLTTLKQNSTSRASLSSFAITSAQLFSDDLYGFRRHELCPLTEVLVPHGDLVDRKTLMQEVEKYIIKPDMITNNTWNECVKTIMYEIKNANAIIEEEDE